MCLLCQAGLVGPGAHLALSVSGAISGPADAAADAASADAAAAGGTKPVFSTSQIVGQLTTSWGGGYTKTLSWPAGTVTYSLPNTPPANFGSTPAEAGGQVVMTAHQQDMARLAFRLWDEVIALSIVESPNNAAANITFAYSSNTGGGTYSAFSTAYGNAAHDRITANQIWLATQWSTNQDAAVQFQSYGFVTYVHEIGHSLGLSHPGTYNAGGGGSITYAASAVYAQDNRQNTVMSYFGGYSTASNAWTQDGTSAGWLYPSTPMIDDIAAIQSLYGADYSTRAGATVYGFNSSFSGSDPARAIYDFALNPRPIYSIWDGGGWNTLDASGFAANQVVDLRAGHYSSIGGLNGNVGIAWGVTMHQAVGGSGNDVLYASDAGCLLLGNGGNDTLIGGAGHDTTITYAFRHAESVGRVGGTVYLAGPAGADQLVSIETVRFFDGVVEYDVASNAAAVLRLYGAALARLPDPLGLGEWSQALDRGQPLTQIASGFVDSVEFQARYGSPDPASYITLLYRNVLHRDPDAGGLQNWLNAMQGGMGRADVLVGFSESAEYRIQTASSVTAGLWVLAPEAVDVLRTYWTVLDRLPDAGGLLDWTTARGNGLSRMDLATSFMNSVEWQQRFGGLSHGEFVEMMYQIALGRHSDPSGFATWTNGLSAGTHSRADVVLGFAYSQELTNSLAPYYAEGIIFG